MTWLDLSAGLAAFVLAFIGGWRWAKRGDRVARARAEAEADMANEKLAELERECADLH